MIQARVIVIDNELSSQGFVDLNESSLDVKNPFELKKTPGFTEYDEISKLMASNGVHWTYPWYDKKVDENTGLTLTAYQTKNQLARIGCFCSHFFLWKECVQYNTPFLILEHDAYFTKKFDLEINTAPLILGINNPLGATRKPQLYHEMIQSNLAPIQEVPKIDDPKVPQGLAGNSAYVITPAAAKKVIIKTRELGAWPNDALLCYQNFNFLRVTRDYYTKVQGLRSTTTL